MYGLGWYFEGVSAFPIDKGVYSIDFALLVISTMMIAAAGNIINDYFDVKADRINKPERLIIGKHIKRRVAIVTHWVINFFAFCIALYLSWRQNSFWYLFIHLASINLLWYYSMYFKRRFLIGNVLIATLTAIVPILVGFFFHSAQKELGPTTEMNIAPFPFDYKDSFILLLSFCLAGFAFVLNLAREIVKDMEDVQGDKKLHAKTLPIVLGYKQSKIISGIILCMAIIGAFVTFSFIQAIDLKVLFPIAISALFVIVCLILLPKADSQSKYKMINGFIKLAMTAGLISPVYWKLILIYG